MIMDKIKVDKIYIVRYQYKIFSKCFMAQTCLLISVHDCRVQPPKLIQISFYSSVHILNLLNRNAC